MIDPRETYRQFARFYDLYAGNFKDDFNFYLKYCKPTDSILEIGCGTGRILKVLLEHGCSMTGVDISDEMLIRAEKSLSEEINNGNLKLLNHDFSVRPLSEKFKKILITFYTFNYILKNPIEFLKNVRQSVSDGGLVLLDLFYPNVLFDKSLNDKWIVKEHHINGKKVSIKDKRKMSGKTEYRQQIFQLDREINIQTQRQYYSVEEISYYLQTAGFSDIQCACGYDTEGFGGMIDENNLKTNFIVKAAF